MQGSFTPVTGAGDTPFRRGPSRRVGSPLEPGGRLPLPLFDNLYDPVVREVGEQTPQPRLAVLAAVVHPDPWAEFGQ